MSRTRTLCRGPARRGSALLVVLALLALFAVVGLSFALYAESEATAARIAREGTNRALDQPPDPTEAVNGFLRQFAYPVADYGPDTLSALRGHELARLIYGNNTQAGAANVVPYNGVGLFADSLILPTVPPTPIDRRQVVNFSFYRQDATAPPTWFIVDPENTQYLAGGQVYLRSGANAVSQTGGAAMPGIYVGKNAPYTYPDRNNMAVALVDPATGMVVVPSFHRPSVFRNPAQPAGQSDLDPANPNWYTPEGRFRLLRPRRIDNLMPNEITTLQKLGLWPPTAANAAAIQNALTAQNLGQFPNPVPNPDGSITGDVQNLKYANGQQHMDSFWLFCNLPVYNWRGKQITPLIAPLVVPLDGRINLNIAGNLKGAGNTHSSNMGFSPSEQNLGAVLVNPALAAQIIQGRFGGANNITGIRTYGTGTGGYTYGTGNKLFHPNPLDPVNPLFQTQPPDYARVDWDGTGTGTSRMALPGSRVFANPPVDLFSSNPVWPDRNTTIPGGGMSPPTPYPGPYDNSYYVPASAGPPPTPATGEAVNHPALYTPYGWDPFGMSSASGTPGSFPLFDMKRLAGRYSDKSVNYTGRTYLGNRFPSAFGGNDTSGAGDPNDVANTFRQLVTVMSNSVKRPGLTPNFFGDPSVSYQLTTPGGVPALTAQPSFNIASIVTQSGGDAKTSNTTPPTAIRDLRATLAGVDLNRPLTDYRSDTSKPLGVQSTTNAGDVLNVGNFQQAWADRQALARDIFIRLAVATGAKIGFDAATNTYVLPQSASAGPPYTLTLTGSPAQTVTQQEYDALRWLAQLAVNIVDYIDNDDISTPFVWNPQNPNDPFNAANFAATTTPSALSDRVVFGVEKPRLVINEAYAEAANDPADKPPAPKATKNFQVRFFFELLNPNNGESNIQNPLAGPSPTTDPGAVPLRFLQAKHPGLAQDISVYQLQVFDDESAVNTDLLLGGGAVSPNVNVTGAVTTKPAKLTCSMTGAFAVAPPTASNLAEWVEPNNGQFAAAATRNGFAVLGPAIDKTSASDNIAYTPDTSAAPYNMILQKPIDPATPPGPDQLLYTIPHTPAAGIKPAVDALKKHAVVLQRLANPYLPPGPTNPYITVDYQTGITVQNAVRIGDDSNPQSPAPQQTNNWSIGRVQPFTAAGTPKPVAPIWSGTTMVLNQQNMVAGKATGNQVSFFRHNSITTDSPTGPAVPTGVLPNSNSETLYAPFQWLTHLDRRLVNQAELFHVAAVKPHELTHQFATPHTPTPWFNQHDLLRPQTVAGGPTNNAPVGPLFGTAAAPSPLYRALEFLTVKPWGHDLPEGGRVPGKVNINMIWDTDPTTGRSRVFNAVLDPQAANGFTQAEIDALWTALKQSRSPGWTGATPVVGSTMDEAGLAVGNDRPFKSLGGALFTAGGNLPGGGSIDDTILRRDPTTQNPMIFLPATDSSTNTARHPYQRAEALRKMLNSFTTVSDNYLVVMTVGWFEVRNTGPFSETNPPVLGKEVFDATPGDMRTQYAAVIDRTNLVAQFAPDPFTATGQQYPWVGELQTPVNPATGAAVRFHALVAKDQVPANKTPGTYDPTTADPNAAGFNVINPRNDPVANTRTFSVSGYYDGKVWTVQAQLNLATSVSTGTQFFIGVGDQAEQVEAFVDPTNPWSYDPTNGIVKITVRAVTRQHNAGEAVSNAIFGNPGPQATFDFRQPPFNAVVRFVGQLPANP